MRVHHSIVLCLMFGLQPLSLSGATTTDEFVLPDLALDKGKVHEDGEYHVVLQPKYRTLISAQIVSPITYLKVRMGDSFKKDEILIKLDDDILIANLHKAHAELEKARTALASRKRLFQDKISSPLEMREAEADAASSEASYVLAQKQLEATAIKAPYNGKVVNVFAQEHELPRTGENLIELINDEVLIANLLVPSSILKNLSVGDPIQIHITETDEVVEGAIARIGSVIDPSSSTIEIEVEIDNKDRKLLAGMIGRTRLTTDRTK